MLLASFRKNIVYFSVEFLIRETPKQLSSIKSTVSASKNTTVARLEKVKKSEKDNDDEGSVFLNPFDDVVTDDDE